MILTGTCMLENMVWNMIDVIQWILSSHTVSFSTHKLHIVVLQSIGLIVGWLVTTCKIWLLLTTV